MKYLMFVLFAVVNLVIILKVPDGLAKLKVLKYLGLAIPLTLVVATLIMLLLKVLNYTPELQFKNTFFSVLMSVLTILLLNCMIIIGVYMLDRMIGFHQVHNANNLDRFPVSFVSKNHINIKTGIKVLFFLGSLLMFYGIWLGKK